MVCWPSLVTPEIDVTQFREILADLEDAFLSVTRNSQGSDSRGRQLPGRSSHNSDQ